MLSQAQRAYRFRSPAPTQRLVHTMRRRRLPRISYLFEFQEFFVDDHHDGRPHNAPGARRSPGRVPYRRRPCNEASGERFGPAVPEKPETYRRTRRTPTWNLPWTRTTAETESTTEPTRNADSFLITLLTGPLGSTSASLSVCSWPSSSDQWTARPPRVAPLRRRRRHLPTSVISRVAAAAAEIFITKYITTMHIIIGLHYVPPLQPEHALFCGNGNRLALCVSPAAAAFSGIFNGGGGFG